MPLFFATPTCAKQTRTLLFSVPSAVIQCTVTEVSFFVNKQIQLCKPFYLVDCHTPPKMISVVVLDGKDGVSRFQHHVTNLSIESHDGNSAAIVPQKEASFSLVQSDQSENGLEKSELTAS